MKTNLLLIALLATSCAKKTSTFEQTSTRDSSATVTLPTRSTSIITQPCDSLGLRPFEVFQVVGRDTLRIIGYRDRIVTEYITTGDTSTQTAATEVTKSETVRTVEVVPKWAWWLLAINAVQVAWFLLRKRIFTFLNNLS
jgi:hypothetical protein